MAIRPQRSSKSATPPRTAKGKSLKGTPSQMQHIGRNIWTRGIKVLLKDYVLLSIISLCIQCTLALAYDTEPLVLSKCDYLNQHFGQSNAFLRNGQFGHICCMCPVGTKYTGICNSNDPTSTVCEICENGMFQDYQPHMQKKCEPQIFKNCLDPYILEEGSITKSSKCICKPGTEEVSNICTPISGWPLITTTPSTISSNSTQSFSSGINTATTMPSTKFNKTNIPVHATPTTHVNSVTDMKSTITDTVSSSTVLTYQDSTNHIKKNEQDYTGLQPGMIVLIAILGMVGIFLSVLVYVYWSRYKTGSPKSDGESVKYEGTSSSTDLSSRCQLMNVNDSPLPGCLPRIRRISSSIQETVQALNEAGPPSRSFGNCVQREDVSITHVVNSVQTEQEDERLLVDDVNVNQEVALHYILPAEKLDEFVQRLTMQWVHPCPLSQYPEMELNDIKPVFRELFNSNHENTMKEIFGANPNDINEIVYNLMKAVQRNLGKDFTPQYIIEKLRKKHPQLKYLTDITVDLLEKYRVAETVQR